jgi:hypothetical protein
VRFRAHFNGFCENHDTITSIEVYKE